MVILFDVIEDNFKKRFEIYSNEGYFYLDEIEWPCNDRRLLARGDSVGELVEWAITNG